MIGAWLARLCLHVDEGEIAMLHEPPRWLPATSSWELPLSKNFVRG
jgi:hypothetical protein